MKLASLWLDDVVVIPGAKDNGSGQGRQDLREQSFHAVDGWELSVLEGERFTIWRDGMPQRCVVGGYGYTLVLAKDSGSSSAGFAPLPADDAGSAPPVASPDTGTNAFDALMAREPTGQPPTLDERARIVAAAKHSAAEGLPLDYVESVARMNATADKLEAHGDSPMAAMKAAVDAVVGPDVTPTPKRRRSK